VLAGLAAVPLAACGRASRARSLGRPAGSTEGLTAGTWTEREIQLVEGAGKAGRMRVFVRPRGKGAAALSSHCGCRPGEGRCPVRWVESSRRFVCPCHGGVYDERGAPMGRTAKRRLERLGATVEDETVLIVAG
jgi:menaquinol-cytochrome c reductase iron-sulfur subunit